MYRKLKKEIKNNLMFVVSVLVFIFIILFAVVDLNRFKEITDILYNICTANGAWLYLISMLVFVVVVTMLAFSRYGEIRLGKDDSKPEYSTKSWFAMLFCAGMGVGLVFWGISEPISHYINPIDSAGKTEEAVDFAFRTVFMHWGIHPWACYAVVGLAVAYFKFRKGKTGLISSTVSNIVHNKMLLNIIDFLAVFATISGIVTSLGLGVMQVNSGLNFLFKIPENVNFQIIIIVTITVIFVFSAVSGVDKGVKLLSNYNLILALLLTMFCFMIGPKLEILNNFTSGLGNYLSNFVNDSLSIRTYGNNGWIYSWRVFYWAWWIAWAPFVGVFIARISKGRKIREFIIGVVLAPTLASVIWFSVWGTLGISLGQHGDLTGGILEEIAGAPERGLFVVLSQYPLGEIISVLTIFLVICFFITSADSGTYVLAMLTSSGNINPSRKKKIVWGTVMSVFAIILLVCGGLKPLQTISIVAALPFMLIMVLQVISLIKDLGENKSL